MESLLEIRDLRTYLYTSHGVVKAVDGVSYDVKAGETSALVGESGCGKTMTALSIMRLVPQPQGAIVGGEIRFQGRDLLKLDQEEMRRVRGADIAMIFQEPMTSLNPVLRIGRQITETLEAHRTITREEAKARALELLHLVGISDSERRLSDYPHQLSGGMRQRVMIAIALSCNPKLILADEPTTALDVTIQAQILELMRYLAQKFGVALIVITHNLGVVARYADRVHVMYGGKVIESGSAAEIYRNPRHPYTIGLLRSVPRLDQPRRAKLDPIQGQPPDLWNLPSGCSFLPRCKFAVEKCAEAVPPLGEIRDNHRSACWVAETLPQEKVLSS
jgi:oligopeptide/dipeptide ABC transporter ATP-binding protein